MQSMSVQQLLQSPKAGAAKGEVATEKLAGLEGLLSKGKGHHVKHVKGQVDSKSEVETGENGEVGEIGEIDFSALLSEAKNGGIVKPGVISSKAEIEEKNGKKEKAAVSENGITSKIAKTSSSLDQLLNNLKGTEDHTGEQNTQSAEESPSLKKGFFPNQKTESENPLDFLVKNTKEKNISSIETPTEEVGEKSELSILMGKLANTKNAQQKNDFFPNKIAANTTVAVSAEKTQTQDQTVKVLSGEDFVKNLNAANPQTKGTQDLVLSKQELEEKIAQKKIGVIPNNIPQIKNYGKGQNILNDNMIRNTNDLAFKDTKKLKSAATDELRSPELKVASELSMIKESPLAALQLKNSPVQENKVSVDTKVLNLSNIDAKNTNAIIKTISDYVEQNQVGNRSSLDLVVKHDSLGQFQIHVNKAPNQNQIDMQITTSSPEGHKFFVAHEADLMKNLQQSGINLSDFRIVSSMKESTPFSQSESKQFSSFQHEQNGDSKQFMSFESGDFREGAQKRKSLWDEYQERYGA